MKIQELFTTLPGILIVSGVVLLVIAIVLFILGNKKAKKEAPAVENKIADEVKEDIVTPAEDTKTAEPVVEPVTITEPEVVPEVEPVVVETPEPIVFEEPKVEEPVVEIPTEPVVEPVVEIPTEPVAITEPVVETPEPIVFEEPKVEEPAPFTMPAMAPVTIEEPVVEEAPAYGGNDPTAAIPVVEEPKPTIYGGADPLEKTQTFPTVEETHQPYGGTPEVKIVDPTFEQTQEPVVLETPEPIKLEEPEEL